MADNIELDPGSGGSTVATDDVSGVHYQLVQLVTGADGGAKSLVTGSTPLPVGDAGGSLTVDGTVAATQSGTWTVTGAGGTFPATDSGGSLTVDAPVGTPVFVRLSDGSAAISALPVTDNGATLSIDDGAGSITVDGTVAVSGTVTIAGAVTNAGTFAVQESGAALAALQLIDNLVLAEDAAHSSGDPGVQLLAVRRDANTTLADTTGDYAPLQVDSGGNLKVAIISGAGSGGTSIADDAAFTVGSTSLTPVGGTYKSTLDAVDDGDAGAFAMTAKRALHAHLVDANGDAVAVAGGTQYTEDAAAAANPVGNAMIVVRDDSRGGSLTTTDGDNVALRGTNAGELYVKHVDALTVSSHAVTNAGTFAVQTGAERAEDAAHSTGHTGLFVLAVRSDTAASTATTDGDYTALVTDSSGRLHVNVGNTVTVGSHAVTNAGTFAVQVDGSALTALQKIDDPVLVDDAAFTPATSSVMMAGFEADEASTDSVDEGDAGAARMTLDRKLIVQPQPHTAGGLSIFRSLDLDESEEEVKGSAGQVYGFWFFNASTSVRYLKLYNATAANVTVGTTTPVVTMPLPAASSGGVAAVSLGAHGIAFDTAITAAVTTGLADNDTGAPSANDVVVNIFYK